MTKHTRLLAPKPELTEFEVTPDERRDLLLNAARKRERAKLDAIHVDYDPADGENTRKPKVWADAETGALCRMVALGWAKDKIAGELKRTPAGVKQKIHDLRRVLGVKSQAEYGAMSGGGAKRKGM